jgi:hypothetical protein
LNHRPTVFCWWATMTNKPKITCCIKSIAYVIWLQNTNINKFTSYSRKKCDSQFWFRNHSESNQDWEKKLYGSSLLSQNLFNVLSKNLLIFLMPQYT